MRQFVVVAALLVLLGTAAAAQPAISFEDQAVVAKGLTPGGAVAWFSVSNERADWLDMLIRRQVETIADGAGSSKFALDSAPSGLSVWAVVDLSTGAFDMVAPPGGRLREISFPKSGLASSAGGKVAYFADDRPLIEVLVARPKVGAWGITAGDGTADDADGATDGHTRISFASMKPLKLGRPAVAGVQPGDAVIVVDPYTMEVYAGTVELAQ
jgi:hypothetical protein